MEQIESQIIKKVFSLNSKEDRINLLKELIIDNPELKKNFSSANNLVFGQGNLDSKIFFIGEAPGQQEDLLAQPFVGPSGKILNQNLDKIGLDRESVYITNIVKYRPDNNRDPSEEEKKLFLPYLAIQILIIQPKLLVTLGRHSMSVFLKSLTINQFHGTIRQIRLKNNNLDSYFLNTQFDLLPLYHPAATLYNYKLRSVFENDFLKLKSYI